MKIYPIYSHFSHVRVWYATATDCVKHIQQGEQIPIMSDVSREHLQGKLSVWLYKLGIEAENIEKELKKICIDEGFIIVGEPQAVYKMP